MQRSSDLLGGLLVGLLMATFYVLGYVIGASSATGGPWTGGGGHW